MARGVKNFVGLPRPWPVPYEVDLQKARLEQETQIAIERMRAESRIDAAQIAAQATLSPQQEAASNGAVQ